MEDPQRMVAVGLLTGHDLSVLGQGFRRMYRPREDDDFSEILMCIDAAERHAGNIAA